MYVLTLINPNVVNKNCVYEMYLDPVPIRYTCAIPRKAKSRDVGSISNLGGMTLRGHFFLKKKGAFSENKKGTSLFIAKSWGHMPPVPPVPPPGSYVYGKTEYEQLNEYFVRMS